MEPIEDINKIPVSIMRQALSDSGLSVSTAAAKIGWKKDTRRLRRYLGYEPFRGKMLKYVEYEMAVQMVRAWDLDPVDYGV